MTAATLQMLLDEGIGLRCRCESCPPKEIGGRRGHTWVLDAKPLAGVLGAHHPIPEVAKVVGCERCGNPDVEVRPDWPSHGVIVTPWPETQETPDPKTGGSL